MTETERLRAVELTMFIGKYANHMISCCYESTFGNPEADYCTCGYSDAAKAYYELLSLLKGKE